MKNKKEKPLATNKMLVIKTEEQTTNQPEQLRLFQYVLSEQYGNGFGLYQNAPCLVLNESEHIDEKGNSKQVAIIRYFKYKPTGAANSQEYKITLRAGYKKSKDNSEILIASYKGHIEETVERALHKLAITDGYFDKDGRFNFITSIYKIMAELNKHKRHNYVQIRDALSVLSTTTIEIEGKDLNGSFSTPFHPISLIRYNPNTNEDSYSESALIKITFNAFVSINILKEEWRQYNYVKFIKDTKSFTRWLRNKLYLNCSFAGAKSSTYHFKLSTAINDDAISIPKDRGITHLKAYIEAQLTKDLADIIATYEITPVQEKRDQSRAITTDYIVTITKFTEEYIQESIFINSLHNNLERRISTHDGEVLLKPLPSQFEDQKEYFKAVKVYEEKVKIIENSAM